MLSKDKGVGIVDAMKALYSSEVYSKLEAESTKVWHYMNLDFVRNMAVGWVASIRNMAVESNFLSEIWQFVGKSYYF